MASNIKATSQKEDVPEKETPETAPDSPLLDLSDAAVKKLIHSAKKRGYVTHDQINSVLSSEEDRAWLSCALDDGKMPLLATDRVALQEIPGLDIMMPEAIDLKIHRGQWWCRRRHDRIDHVYRHRVPPASTVPPTSSAAWE
jgi:Sigma-70 factor, region 1.1